MLVVGAIFLINGIKDKVEFDKPHGDLETISANELYVGRVVEGTIYELWDEFAYTSEYNETLGIKTSKERTTDRYFAMPLESSFASGSPVFVAVCTRDKTILKTFEQMEKETNDYYNGNDYDEYTKIHYVGKVKRLSNEYLQFFREYIAYQYDVSEAEAAKFFVPYVLVATSGERLVPSIIIGAVMTVIGLGGMALFIIRKVLTGK